MNDKYKFHIYLLMSSSRPNPFSLTTPPVHQYSGEHSNRQTPSVAFPTTSLFDFFGIPSESASTLVVPRESSTGSSNRLAATATSSPRPNPFASNVVEGPGSSRPNRLASTAIPLPNPNPFASSGSAATAIPLPNSNPFASSTAQIRREGPSSFEAGTAHHERELDSEDLQRKRQRRVKLRQRQEELRLQEERDLAAAIAASMIPTDRVLNTTLAEVLHDITDKVPVVNGPINACYIETVLQMIVYSPQLLTQVLRFNQDNEFLVHTLTLLASSASKCEVNMKRRVPVSSETCASLGFTGDQDDAEMLLQRILPPSSYALVPYNSLNSHAWKNINPGTYVITSVAFEGQERRGIILKDALMNPDIHRTEIVPPLLQEDFSQWCNTSLDAISGKIRRLREANDTPDKERVGFLSDELAAFNNQYGQYMNRNTFRKELHAIIYRRGDTPRTGHYVVCVRFPIPYRGIRWLHWILFDGSTIYALKKIESNDVSEVHQLMYDYGLDTARTPFLPRTMIYVPAPAKYDTEKQNILQEFLRKLSEKTGHEAFELIPERSAPVWNLYVQLKNDRLTGVWKWHSVPPPEMNNEAWIPVANIENGELELDVDTMSGLLEMSQP